MTTPAVDAIVATCCDAISVAVCTSARAFESQTVLPEVGAQIPQDTARRPELAAGAKEHQRGDKDQPVCNSAVARRSRCPCTTHLPAALSASVLS